MVERPKTLDERIAFREAHLVEYQGKRLAKRYRRMLDGIEDRKLKEAVAHGYHKVLTYKDEYEVARLHLETRKRAEEAFEGDFKMNFHLAPPIMSKEGSDGRPIKKKYRRGDAAQLQAAGAAEGAAGHAARPVRPVRGAEDGARADHAIRGRHGGMAAEARPRRRASRSTALAELPLSIRGFGPVKQANAEKAEKRREELLAVLRDGGASMAKAAE